MEQVPTLVPPHVLVFPFPVQSHVNVMLNLAEIFSISGFQAISDGLPLDHPRTGDRVKELFDSINVTTKPQFRNVLKSRALSSNGRAPLTCIIADGIMSFTIDIAQDFGLPTILFRPFSATCFWTLFCVPKLIQAGELPLKEDSDMDRLVENIPGMERVLRVRDLPSFCRVEDAADPQLQHVVSETHRATGAHGLILNTLEDLEEPALARIRANFPKLYVIGPLHGYFRPLRSPNSLSRQHRNCVEWLDDQPLKSVVFVSFGNMTVLKSQQLVEFWYGLVNSGKPFLWVVPANLTAGCRIPTELIEGNGNIRGKVVDWAPQEEVLSHPATGGF
ncbi:UNVERIFIED_CONTAM: 7-deoxyloganetic acid glucosyl transferase [Sesamum calycinum]|uniref:7-deoxyloganetic acid glucosyl transferase n=1 Tax=Sesamum calycinum TaxID=2727403 RepID=A0AAW2RPL0_9LAMI